jgi:hypothetical protein
MTLDPGIYDPSEAPYWRFTNDQTTTVVVKQWMKEAAEAFAIELSKINWGGETSVEVVGMTTDGMTGYYQVSFEHHRMSVPLTVHRGEQTECEDAKL